MLDNFERAADAIATETDREASIQAPSPPSPPPRTKWTRRVPHPVLIGHAAPVEGRGGSLLGSVSVRPPSPSHNPSPYRFPYYRASLPLSQPFPVPLPLL